MSDVARFPRCHGATICVFVWFVMASTVAAAPIEEALPPLTTDQDTDTNQTDAVDRSAAPLPAKSNLWRADPRLQSPAIAAARRELSAGNLPACVEQIHAACAEDDNLPPPALTLAFVCFGEEDWPRGLQALEQAAIRHPRHPEVYLAAGQIALMQGRHLDASVHLEKALALDPPPQWTAEQADAFPTLCLDGLATVAERRRDWPTAAVILNRWLEHDSADAELLDRAGRALFGAKKLSEAFDAFDRSYQLNEAMNPPELSMAALHATDGDFEAAAPWYEKAKQKYPDDGRVYFEHAGGLLLAGRLDDAQQLLDKAIEVGKNLDSAAAEVELLQAMIARGKGEFSKAEGHFTAVLQNSPGHFQAMRQMPLVLIEQDDPAKHERARQMARILVKRFPQSPAAAVTLGWVTYRSGNAEEAAAILKAATAQQADAESLFFTAQVLLEAGAPSEVKRAMTALENAMQQPGAFLQREQAEQWLKASKLLVN